jgi:2-oxoglutarate dehydrogenase E1 component
MGVWPYFCRKFRNSDIKLDVISRKESSSTATGYAKQHVSQQLYIIGKAFEDNAGAEVKKSVVETTNKAVKVD